MKMVTFRLAIIFYFGQIALEPTNSVNVDIPNNGGMRQLNAITAPDQVEVGHNIALNGPVYENKALAMYEGDESSSQCHYITEPICQGLQYSHTYLPNSVGLTSQDEAAKRMNDYQALISVGCSKYLKFFLCTVYFPMCAPTPGAMKTLQPCRTFCRYVQSKCEPIMKSFSFPWPIELNCNGFPATSDMCIQPETYELDKQIAHYSQRLSNVSPKEIAELLPDLNALLHEKYTKEKSDTIRNPELIEIPSTSYPANGQLFAAGPDRSTKNVRCNIAQIPLLPHKTGENITCAQLCQTDLFYRHAEKRFTEVWMLIWSVLCAMSCAITIGTFIIDRSRFTYPERAIVYISTCCLCYSLGFILRIAFGREKVACREFTEGNTQEDNNYLVSYASPNPHLDSYPHTHHFQGSKYLITSGHEGTICTIVFIITYYFIQASSLWWVMLAVAWFLSAVCKWGCEGIDAVSSVMHLIAWAVPAIKTMIVLILHRIDADELTGLCGVGYTDRQSQLIFVLLPQLIYLIIGLVLFTVGFASLISVRANLKQHTTLTRTTSQHSPIPGQSACSLLHESSKTSSSTAVDYKNVRRLEKLMMKICVFSTLYVFPSVCVIGVNWYTFFGQQHWEVTVSRISSRPGCLSESGTHWDSLDECLDGMSFPVAEVRMLHIFMSLVVGITTGMWIWCNRKTFSSWSRCVLGKNGQTIAMKPTLANKYGVKKQGTSNSRLIPRSMKSLFKTTQNQNTNSAIYRSVRNAADAVGSNVHKYYRAGDRPPGQRSQQRLHSNAASTPMRHAEPIHNSSANA